MKQYLLLTSALVLSSGVADAACIQTPTCGAMGYDSTVACEGGIKCPFGNAWNCTLADKIAQLEITIEKLEQTVQDEALSKCQIGDILYSDMSCNTNVVISKTPIGVVFDTTNRLAVGLRQDSSFRAIWSADSFDVTGLNNLNSNLATADWQGKKNTQIVLEYCKANGKSCPAFEYVSNYKTEGTQAGDWYLPAGGELTAIYKNLDSINKSLTLVGGSNILYSHVTSPAYYFSSSENSSNEAWALYIYYHDYAETNVGYLTAHSKSETDYVMVVPVLAF